MVSEQSFDAVLLGFLLGFIPAFRCLLYAYSKEMDKQSSIHRTLLRGVSTRYMLETKV